MDVCTYVCVSKIFIIDTVCYCTTFRRNQQINVEDVMAKVVTTFLYQVFFLLSVYICYQAIICIASIRVMSVSLQAALSSRCHMHDHAKRHRFIIPWIMSLYSDHRNVDIDIFFALSARSNRGLRFAFIRLISFIENLPEL